MIWQAIAEEQTRIIEELTNLCSELISQLSQFKNIEAEEKILERLKEETDGKNK